MQLLHLGLFSSHLMRRFRQASGEKGLEAEERRSSLGKGDAIVLRRRRWLLTEAASLGPLLHGRLLALGVVLVVALLQRRGWFWAARLGDRRRAASLGHGSRSRQGNARIARQRLVWRSEVPFFSWSWAAFTLCVELNRRPVGSRRNIDARTRREKEQVKRRADPLGAGSAGRE